MNAGQLPWPAISGAVPDFLPQSAKVPQKAAGSEERKTDIIDEQQPGANQWNPDMIRYAQNDRDRYDKEDEEKPGGNQYQSGELRFGFHMVRQFLLELESRTGLNE